MLTLHDTATGQVVPLRPRQPGKVGLYVCGPTVDGVPHLGHGRFSLVFDVLRRYLLFSGLEVTYVSNITDIEDKIIERAADRGVPIDEFTAANEALWWEIMDALGVLRPDETPHATAYVDRMIDLIRDLVGRGVAYETATGVYLSVMDVPGYGLLARQPLESLRAGARIEADEEKRSPLDFVLWKKAKPGEPSWEAPWGAGRPGWHTECVVMSLDLLGEGFELHGGGQDLMFPHHENERAQAVADGKEFARHWMHNGWVTVGGEKMSKSLGNFTSLADLLERSDARAYRVLVLRSHYRSPIEVTPETIADAESGLARLDELARRFDLPDQLSAGPVVDRPSSAPSEAYRMLRMSVLFEALADTSSVSGGDPFAEMLGLSATTGEAYRVPDAGSRRVVLVVSAQDEPSRPRMVANLAASFAEASERVVVINTGDLDVGTSLPADSVLTGPLTREDVESRMTPAGPANVSLLSMRHFMVNSGQLVTRAPDVFEVLRSIVDVVIVEVPSFLRFHHGEALIHSADAVVVVVESGVTAAGDGRQMGEVLRRLGAPVLGVAFTGQPLSADERKALDADAAARTALGVGGHASAPLDTLDTGPDAAATAGAASGPHPS